MMDFCIQNDDFNANIKAHAAAEAAKAEAAAKEVYNLH